MNQGRQVNHYTHTRVEWAPGITWATSAGRHDLGRLWKGGQPLLTDWGFLLGHWLQGSGPALHGVDLRQNRRAGSAGAWTCLSVSAGWACPLCERLLSLPGSLSEPLFYLEPLVPRTEGASLLLTSRINLSKEIDNKMISVRSHCSHSRHGEFLDCDTYSSPSLTTHFLCLLVLCQSLCLLIWGHVYYISTEHPSPWLLCLITWWFLRKCTCHRSHYQSHLNPTSLYTVPLCVAEAGFFVMFRVGDLCLIYHSSGLLDSWHEVRSLTNCGFRSLDPVLYLLVEVFLFGGSEPLILQGLKLWGQEAPPLLVDHRVNWWEKSVLLLSFVPDSYSTIFITKIPNNRI